MKKILVTGSFTGAVVVMYGEPGVDTEAQPGILSVDMGGAALEDKQKMYVLHCVPLRYGAGYEQNWGPLSGKVQIVTEDYEVEFERDFFKPYGKQVNRKRCLKLWDNMSREKRALAVIRRSAYARHLDRNTWKTKADPETFLRKEMYLNDWDNLP